LEFQIESFSSHYNVKINEQQSSVMIHDLHTGKELSLDLNEFENVNPSHQLESIFGLDCRTIHCDIKKALSTPPVSTVLDETLIIGVLDLMLQDYRTIYGNNLSTLKSRVYHAAAVDFWEKIPGIVQRHGYVTDNKIMDVAKELEHRRLIDFNEARKGFILTELALAPPVIVTDTNFIDKANAFFSKHQFLMAILALIGLVFTVIGFF